MNNRKFNFIGINFNGYTLDQSLDKIEEYINSGKPHRIFTPNAELIVRASKDSELKKIYNETDIVTLDSWVTYYSAKCLGKPVREPASAANMMFKILPRVAEKGYTVYLLGAKPDVVQEVKNRLEDMGIKVVGLHDGYFDKDNPIDVVKDIKEKRPQILFVAMSTPYKEDFIAPNMEEMNVPVSIGVGGSFDIIAGRTKHAPVWISKLGMEWFYRFVQEPRRMWKRYLITNTNFVYLWIKELILGTSD